MAIRRASSPQRKPIIHLGFLAIVIFSFVSLLISLQTRNSETPSSLQSVLETSKERPRRPTELHPITTTDLPDYHVVFSTSCEPLQDWESYVFFYHAWKVGQRGSVTRICSGCSDEDGLRLTEFHERHIRTMSTDFHLHLTPDFSRGKEYVKIGKARYKYMNKPYGLHHWLTDNMNRTSDDDAIVILMDPDMVLLRPIVHNFSHQEVIWAEGQIPPQSRLAVKHGFPMAQQDGYLNTQQWITLNSSYVMDGKGGTNHIKMNDGQYHYNAGPPYLATVKDMKAIASLWVDYAPRVYEIYPKLFAEMFGYIFATIQLDLPHTLIKSLVVSTTETKRREGWQYIDTMPDDDICMPASLGDFKQQIDISSKVRLPIGLHYCKRYLLDKWFFSKYRLKKHYISCETPILQMPPLNLTRYQFTESFQPPPNRHPIDERWDPPVSHVSPHQAKRESFMLCQMIRSVNEAAFHFKKSFCENPNFNSNYTFFNDWND